MSKDKLAAYPCSRSIVKILCSEGFCFGVAYLQLRYRTAHGADPPSDS